MKPAAVEGIFEMCPHHLSIMTTDYGCVYNGPVKDALYSAPKVGGDILAFCAKCKIELAHIVAAMVGSTPKKVICKTCKGQHNYRRISLPGSKVRVNSTATSKRLPRSAQALWELRMSENPSRPTVTYSAKSRFTKGDAIQHPSFGLGIVEEVRLSGKILVLFREGEKILIHERTDSPSQP